MTFTLPDPLVAALRKAQSIAVLTGAGISAESGVPTFRDAQAGLWSRYDPQELATADGFAMNPKLVPRHINIETNPKTPSFRRKPESRGFAPK